MQQTLDLPEHITVAELLDRLELTLHPDHLLLVVNRKIVTLSYQLQPGDRVDLIPALSGGEHLHWLHAEPRPTSSSSRFLS